LLIDIAAAPGHARSQVEPPEQFTEQLPVHVMWQVAPPEQSTLALVPTVIVQSDWPVHLRLHDSPHWPLHTLLFAQSSEQLLSQVPAGTSQVSPAGQLHDAPEQVGGVPLLLLHAATAAPRIKPSRRIRILHRTAASGPRAATAITPRGPGRDARAPMGPGVSSNATQLRCGCCEPPSRQERQEGAKQRDL